MSIVVPNDIFWKILNTAIELDFKKGHMRWSMSELSRESGITRSLIYYYFGKDKLQILLEAVKALSTHVLGLDPRRMAQWKEGRLREAVLEGYDGVHLSPMLPIFYMLHRRVDNSIGEAFRDMEKKYLEKIASVFPKFSEDERRILFGFLFGVVATPFSTESSVKRATELIEKYLKMPA
jgi:AcrR family transcriptional regulator